MFRLFPSEEFREAHISNPDNLRYAVSNYGRIITFTETFSDGHLQKEQINKGYRQFSYKAIKDGKTVRKYKMVYNMVAELFIPKTSDEQKHVLHLDRNSSHDHVKNLVWATPKEKVEFHKTSPNVIAGRKKTTEHNIKADGRKLTSTQVIRLKKELLNPNRKTRIKILAKQFGISEMQLYRIKRGENWGHIKV
jgi:hypothetical protein